MITDPDGRLLCCGQTRPGSIHDLTQVRQAGLVELLALVPGVTLLADAGYRGLSAQTAGAVPVRGRARSARRRTDQLTRNSKRYTSPRSCSSAGRKP